jgi:hypothetical protein
VSEVKWLAWLAFLIFVGVASAAPLYTQALVFHWEPSEGPVVQYECELSNGAISRTATTSMTVGPWSGGVAVRCRGLDVAEVGSPWSLWSKIHSCKWHKGKGSYRCSR